MHCLIYSKVTLFKWLLYWWKVDRPLFELFWPEDDCDITEEKFKKRKVFFQRICVDQKFSALALQFLTFGGLLKKKKKPNWFIWTWLIFVLIASINIWVKSKHFSGYSAVNNFLWDLVCYVACYELPSLHLMKDLFQIPFLLMNISLQIYKIY